MAADALFLRGSFETSFEHGFHRSSHSHSGVPLPELSNTCSHPPPFVHLEDNLSDDSHPWLKPLNYQKPSGATWEMQQWQMHLETIHFFPPAY